ncbi:MAG: beta-ketoacyl synthase N-terminal-like domain-containing protein [Planctomycetota bacterium]
MRPTVAVTGLGPISAAGVGIEPLWQAMLEGRSCLQSIQRFDPSGFPCQIAGQLPADEFRIRDFVPKSYRKATKVMCRDIELAVAAADVAVRHAGLVTKGVDADAEPTIPADRFGCHIGAGLIAADVEELTAALITSKDDDGNFDIGNWGSQGMTNLTPLWLLKYLPNMLACHVTIVHDCQGPSNTITCCEASSLLSLGESMRVIERGAASACLTGGAEYKLNPVAFFRQHCAKRLAAVGESADPTTAIKPFDANALGTALGEGGGILVLEDLESARARGGTVLAEIAGYAATQSRCRDTLGLDLDPTDPATSDAIRAAIDQAGLSPDDIDAIVPFGSAIPSVDAVEAHAIRSAFGERAASIPLITPVPYVGNCNAGIGAVNLCVGVQALAAQKLPARINTAGVDGLDANACAARDAELNHVLVFTTSQGGQNAAVVLRRAS